MNEKKLKQDLKKINPACVLADHLFGKEHNVHHKMICGLLLMAVGVVISKVDIGLFPYSHYLTDGVGYFLHGMGGIPYGEWLASIPVASTINDTLDSES